MATLSETDRRRVWRGLMRYWSAQGITIPGNVKDDIYQAVVDTDEFIEDNQSAYNSALNATFRTNASLTDKTLLFCAVAAMRVSAGFCRLLFGDLG
jgi:hypothetical protein